MPDLFGWLGYAFDVIEFVVDYWHLLAIPAAGGGGFWLGRKR